jgi:uncharacterized protein (DUF433 family)
VTATISVSTETYKLLQRRAEETRSTPESVAENVLRLQLGNTVHIEQRLTSAGPQAYLRGTRVAVRHVAAFLKSGHTADDIVKQDLPHLSAAAVYEAIAYCYDHQAEIEAELAANAPDRVQPQLQQQLTPEQYARLTGRAA